MMGKWYSQVIFKKVIFKEKYLFILGYKRFKISNRHVS